MKAALHQENLNFKTKIDELVYTVKKSGMTFAAKPYNRRGLSVVAVTKREGYDGDTTN